MYGTSHRNFNSSGRSVSRSVHGRSRVSRRNRARDIRIVAQMISACDLSEFARFFLILILNHLVVFDDRYEVFIRPVNQTMANYIEEYVDRSTRHFFKINSPAYNPSDE